MLVVGDIFCVVVVVQLQVWGECNGVVVVVQGQNVDVVLVVFDVLQVGKVCGIEVLIVDIVGCLYIQFGLMNELGKICCVLGKIDLVVLYEVLMVIDGIIGQNVFFQLCQFYVVVNVIGLVVIKLDGIVKGGVVFVLVCEFGILICFVGIGECLEDLCVFDLEVFVDVLLFEVLGG